MTTPPTTPPPPDWDRAIIDPCKLTHYLLDACHPVGAPKARFFERFGFSRDHPDHLAHALLQQAVEAARVESVATAFGWRYIAVGPLVTPSGRTPWIETIWQLNADKTLHLITATPTRESAL